MTIVYAGDTWTLEARLPYVVGETLTKNNFSVLIKINDKYALATPSVAYLMKELAAGFPGGHWNQTIATGNFRVKPRIVNSVVVGN